MVQFLRSPVDSCNALTDPFASFYMKFGVHIIETETILKHGNIERTL